MAAEHETAEAQIIRTLLRLLMTGNYANCYDAREVNAALNQYAPQYGVSLENRVIRGAAIQKVKK